MESKSYMVATAQIRYKQVLVYNKLITDREKTSKLSESRLKRLKDSEKYSGKITVGAKKRMAKAIDTLLMISPSQKIINPVSNRFQSFQLTFITLTISDNTKIYDVKYCNENLLRPFLRWLREKMKAKSYLWKVELQERGQPHYHLTTNVFLRYDYIKNYWNYLQYKLGMLEDYIKRFGASSPNSTDIHAVFKVQDIKKYLLKYMQKSTQNEIPVNGKIWDCSENLKKFKSFELFYDDMMNSNMLKWLTHQATEEFQNEHCRIYTNKVLSTVSLLKPKHRIEFIEYLNMIKNHN